MDRTRCVGQSKQFVWVFGILLLFWMLMPVQSLHAQTCVPGQTSCQDDDDCRPPINDCPSCYVCQGGVCVADNTICETLDGNDCVTGLCLDPPANPSFNPTGCDYTVSVFNGSTGLDELCYYCDPARITSISTCGNGVCNAELEDCQSCPEDCLVPGFDSNCPEFQIILNVACGFLVDLSTFSGPPFNEQQSFLCEDGDVCTDNVCDVQLEQCDVSPKTCSQETSDLCCPSGCQGPPTGISSCEEASELGLVPFDECDIDCWPTQSCGDTLVESPETCDDTVPGPNAGINVTDEECRDAGSAAECTYCGDGIVQAAAGEQCDLNNDSACGTDGCDLSTCQCVQNLCVTGSGNPIDTIRTGCGNCALEKGAVSNGWQSYVGWLSFFLLIPVAWVLRRRMI